MIDDKRDQNSWKTHTAGETREKETEEEEEVVEQRMHRMAIGGGGNRYSFLDIIPIFLEGGGGGYVTQSK